MKRESISVWISIACKAENYTDSSYAVEKSRWDLLKTGAVGLGCGNYLELTPPPTPPLSSATSSQHGIADVYATTQNKPTVPVSDWVPFLLGLLWG